MLGGGLLSAFASSVGKDVGADIYDRVTGGPTKPPPRVDFGRPG
jgi:hypothetical protein